MAIRRRDIPAHQRWMTRVYALGMAAATQVLTHIAWLLWPGLQGERLRAMCMGAGWAINIVVAQWVLKRPHDSEGRPEASASHGQTPARL